jgi:hypothetical protein
MVRTKGWDDWDGDVMWYCQLVTICTVTINKEQQSILKMSQGRTVVDVLNDFDVWNHVLVL